MTSTKIGNIGENLKRIRKEKGMRQIDVAKKLGIQPATYCKYELNMHKPKYKLVERVANVLDVDVSEILLDTSNLIIDKDKDMDIDNQNNNGLMENIIQEMSTTMLRELNSKIMDELMRRTVR